MSSCQGCDAPADVEDAHLCLQQSSSNPTSTNPSHGRVIRRNGRAFYDDCPLASSTESIHSIKSHSTLACLCASKSAIISNSADHQPSLMDSVDQDAILDSDPSADTKNSLLDSVLTRPLQNLVTLLKTASTHSILTSSGSDLPVWSLQDLYDFYADETTLVPMTADEDSDNDLHPDDEYDETGGSSSLVSSPTTSLPTTPNTTDHLQNPLDNHPPQPPQPRLKRQIRLPPTSTKPILVILHHTIYNIRPFLRCHPAGPSPLLSRIAQDATYDYDMHSSQAKEMWLRMEKWARLSKSARKQVQQQRRRKRMQEERRAMKKASGSGKQSESDKNGECGIM